MARAYVVRRPDGSVTEDLPLRKAMDRVRTTGRRLGPRWRVGERGEDPGPWRDSFGDTTDRLRDRLRDGIEGERYVLEGEELPGTVAVRVVETAPPVHPTEGNARIDAIHAWVVQRFPGEIRSAGICVRKVIAGTSTWSQHSPWPTPDPGANAWDWFAPGFERLLEQAAGVVGAARRGELPVGRVIVGDRTWTPAAGWQDYGGAFHYHVHVEGSPTRSGQPKGSC